MEPNDPDRVAFTSALIAALKDLDHRKAPSTGELGQRAYEKLQYDLPLVSTEELRSLDETLRGSLQLKSHQPPFPLTAKLLENIITGARAPTATAPAAAASGAAASLPGHDAAASSKAANGHTGNGIIPTDTDTATPAAAEAASTPQSSLLQPALMSPDRHSLSAAYRALCSTVIVQLVAHCLSVSEQETWALLHGVAPGPSGDEDASSDGDGPTGAAPDHAREPTGPGPSGDTTGSLGVEQERKQAAGDASTAGSQLPSGPDTEASISVPALPHPLDHREEPMAAAEDGDDFVYEDIDAPGAPPSSTTTHTTPSAPPPVPPPAPPPYSWPALRGALLRMAGQVSYAGLLDEPELWADGSLLAGVFQLLRALGAHRHAQELAPLLGAYVGLLADRLAAEPGELGCLEGLWDAVGLSCIASLPAQVGKQRSSAAGRQGSQHGPLLAEATTCLSLVAGLAGQLSAASARQRLWQQVHRRLLPLLERCLGDLARAVGAGHGAKAAAKQQEQERRGPGPEEVAAIVLVCQVLDFYVQQRPGNADLGAALKGSGVLASLAVLLAAAGGLPGAEPLRSAALCCAASSRELASWMLAVPGVAKALAAPAFQEGGPCEAHGAMWELLASGGSSPMALSILAGGAAPEKAARVHALLQLLSKAAACRGGSAAGLWGPAIDRALRELLAALREEQNSAAGSGWRSGPASGPAAAGVASGLSGLPADGSGVCAASGEADGDDDDEDDDEEKLRLLDPAALQRRRARQLHPSCWRILKQLLTEGGRAGGKTD